VDIPVGVPVGIPMGVQGAHLPGWHATTNPIPRETKTLGCWWCIPSWQVSALDTHGDTHRNTQGYPQDTYRDTHRDAHRDTHRNNIELDANRRGPMLRFLCLVGPG
jgi:hypothetical protein